MNISIFNWLKKTTNPLDVKKVAEKQLDRNMQAIKSLRDYDEGKKNISTSNIERHLPDIRVAR